MDEPRTPRPTSTGECGICGATFAKAAMTRHLQSCQRKKAQAEKLPAGAKQGRAKVFHLLIEGRYNSRYWLHLEVPASMKLGQVDDFLRDTWLECCGHLSAFSIQGREYHSQPSRDLGGKSMNVELWKVLTPGLKFSYEYDFGTTTELAGKVIAAHEVTGSPKDLRVLARNDPPPILCQVCQKPATNVCTQCIYEGGGWLCDECAAGHECGEEMLLPVVNSPRVGMCGYTG